MHQITVISIAMAYLASLAAAGPLVARDNCVVGLNYCGSGLLNKGAYLVMPPLTICFVANLHILLVPNYNTDLLHSGNYRKDILAYLRASHQSTDENHVNFSLFYCAGADAVPWQQYCGVLGCNDGGTGRDDYCD